MARNGTWPVAIAIFAAAAGAEDALVERWDNPKRETFELPGAWPDRVVETLTERFGVPVELDPVDVKRADFAAKDATFFEALDAFAALHRLGVLTARGDDGGVLAVRLVRAERATPVAYLGPTRLSVQSVTVVTVREFGAGKGDDVPTASYREPSEPKLRLRLHWLVEQSLKGVTITSWNVSADDDLGKRMTRVENRWEPPAMANGDFDLVFAPPTRGAKAVTFKGTARVALPLEQGRIEFLAAEAGQTKSLGGARLKLEKIDGSTVSFRMKGSPCPGVQGDIDVQVGSEDGLGLGNANPMRMLAYDAEGNEIAPGSSTESSSDWLGRRDWKIELAAAPARIVFEALVRGAEREVAFSFADIPLPE